MDAVESVLQGRQSVTILEMEWDENPGRLARKLQHRHPGDGTSCVASVAGTTTNVGRLAAAEESAPRPHWLHDRGCDNWAPMNAITVNV
jgi:hypothetical protein